MIHNFLNDRKPSSSSSSRSSPVSRSQVQDSYEYFKREKPVPKHDNSALHDSIKQVNDIIRIINNISFYLGNGCNWRLLQIFQEKQKALEEQRNLWRPHGIKTVQRWRTSLDGVQFSSNQNKFQRQKFKCEGEAGEPQLEERWGRAEVGGPDILNFIENDSELKSATLNIR